MIDIRVDGLEDLHRALITTFPNEIKTAMRNAINDTARDVMKREEQEIVSVFNRPTPKIQHPFFVAKATKTNLVAEVKIKDVYGRFGNAFPNTLKPHIHGYRTTREAKGMERALRHKGLLGSDEFLVPSRTMKLNQYGNIPGAMASKMLNDLWVFHGVPGYDSDTSERKRKYMWGEVTARNGRTTKGIWDSRKFLTHQPKALLMMVVKKHPTYTKRFDFFRIGQDEVKRAIKIHATSALQHAFRRNGRT